LSDEGPEENPNADSPGKVPKFQRSSPMGKKTSQKVCPGQNRAPTTKRGAEFSGKLKNQMEKLLVSCTCGGRERGPLGALPRTMKKKALL